MCGKKTGSKRERGRERGRKREREKRETVWEKGWKKEIIREEDRLMIRREIIGAVPRRINGIAQTERAAALDTFMTKMV